MRKAWRRPLAGFSLGIGGAAVALSVANPIGAAIGFASALLGLKRQADPASADTYLFRAEQQ
jgi:Na+-driven multidrug efflux pump